MPSQLAAVPPTEAPEGTMPAAPQSLPEVTVTPSVIAETTAPSQFIPGEPPNIASPQEVQSVLSNPQTAAIVQNIAASYGVDIGTAALILRLFAMGESSDFEPIRAMKDGGRPMANEAVLVGEDGPELFVPDVPGAIVPYVPPIGKGSKSWPKAPTPDYPGMYAGYGREIQRQNRERQNLAPLLMQMIDTGALKLNEKAWDDFIKAQKPSKNIEDRRGN